MNHKPVEILLVEDNAFDVELTTRALRKNNLVNEIRVVRDGEEALEFFFGAKADPADWGNLKLVLLDLKLPKVDGLQVLRKLKEDERTCVLPVVILTSSKEDQDLVRSYQLGVNSYLQKPVDFVDFQEMVRQMGLYWLLVNNRAEVATAQK
jgi:two-component system response regulator